MPDHSDSYSISAKHYDASYATLKTLVDLPFYVDLAKKSGGPVLELACGTGRVLLPIAREGLEIDGVDNSAPMLDILRSHLEKEPPQIRQRVTLHEADIRTFRTNKKFALVIIPFRPMQHMFTLQDQISSLTTAAAHMHDSGCLAFDVFYPKLELIFAGIGQEVLDLEWTVESNPAKTIRRYFKKDSVDKIHQVFSGAFIFRTFEGEKLVHEETEPLKMSYYTYPHLQSLFKVVGLEPIAEYGSFAKAPLDNSSHQMIFVLKKSNRTPQSS
jgi:SAM-dependent methyltransferase